MAYYEQQLERAERDVYGIILRGVLAADKAIRVPLLPMRTLSEIYTRLRLDHPEVFYLNGFTVRAVPGADSGELVPDYLFDKAKVLMHRQAIQTRLERLTRDLKGKNERERIAFLHRFVIEKVRYDKLKKPYSHEVIGPLTQGVGVCEGIAKTVKLLADALNIECAVALTAPGEGKRYGHAWNVLKCGGKWYHFDATFDLSLSACGEERCDYVLLPDALIYRDHDTPVYPVPACSDGDHFWYREQKLSFTKQEELAKRIAQAAKRKQQFVFHWRGGYLTKRTLPELLNLITDASRSTGKCAKIALNLPQAVFLVQFSALTEAETQLTLENADEANEEQLPGTLEFSLPEE